MTTTLTTASATAEKVIESLAKIEGPLLTGISLFVPGAAAVTVPLETILPLILPDIENALNAIATGNQSNLWATVAEFINHITAGKPNSPVLSAAPAAAAAPTTDPTVQ
jgi:hypothetical protein